MPIWGLAIIFSAILVVLVIVLTDWEQRPKYHWVSKTSNFT